MNCNPHREMHLWRTVETRIFLNLGGPIVTAGGLIFDAAS